jgi:hypothetical protein
MPHALYTTLRPALSAGVAVCAAGAFACAYFGYWFSHMRA